MIRSFQTWVIILLCSTLQLDVSGQISIGTEAPPSPAEEEIRRNFKKEKGSYKSGKKNGYWEYYHALEDTRSQIVIKAEGTYKDGVKNGIWKFNGLGMYKDTIAEYANGLPHGTWTIFQSKDNPHSVIEYEKGVMKSRKEIRYHKLFSEERVFENGDREILFYVDSLVRQSQYFNSDSLKIGEWKVFKGEDLHFIELYENDVRMGKDWYYPSGQLKANNVFVPEMYGISYYENGQVKSEKIFKDKKMFNVFYFTSDGDVRDNGGFKDGNGLLYSYDSNGNIIGEETYKDQKIIESKWHYR